MPEFELTFKAPEKDAPGYLPRMYRAAAFMESVSAKTISVKVLDDLIEFLLDFVTQPTDRTEAKAAMMELSEADFESMLGSMVGSKKEIVPPAPSGDSGTG